MQDTLLPETRTIDGVVRITVEPSQFPLCAEKLVLRFRGGRIGAHETLLKLLLWQPATSEEFQRGLVPGRHDFPFALDIPTTLHASAEGAKLPIIPPGPAGAVSDHLRTYELTATLHSFVNNIMVEDTASRSVNVRRCYPVPWLRPEPPLGKVAGYSSPGNEFAVRAFCPRVWSMNERREFSLELELDPCTESTGRVNSIEVVLMQRLRHREAPISGLPLPMDHRIPSTIASPVGPTIRIKNPPISSLGSDTLKAEVWLPMTCQQPDAELDPFMLEHVISFTISYTRVLSTRKCTFLCPIKVVVPADSDDRFLNSLMSPNGWIVRPAGFAPVGGGVNDREGSIYSSRSGMTSASRRSGGTIGGGGIIRNEKIDVSDLASALSLGVGLGGGPVASSASSVASSSRRDRSDRSERGGYNTGIGQISMTSSSAPPLTPTSPTGLSNHLLRRPSASSQGSGSGGTGSVYRSGGGGGSKNLPVGVGGGPMSGSVNPPELATMDSMMLGGGSSGGGSRGRTGAPVGFGRSRSRSANNGGGGGGGSNLSSPAPPPTPAPPRVSIDSVYYNVGPTHSPQNQIQSNSITQPSYLQDNSSSSSFMSPPNSPPNYNMKSITPSPQGNVTPAGTVITPTQSMMMTSRAPIPAIANPATYIYSSSSPLFPPPSGPLPPPPPPLPSQQQQQQQSTTEPVSNVSDVLKSERPISLASDGSLNLNQPAPPTNSNQFSSSVDNYDPSTTTTAKSNINEPPQQQPQSQNQTFTVQYAFNPTMPDELCLSVGDVVEVIEAFDDGWARGKLVSIAIGKDVGVGGVGGVGSSGYFPIRCLVLPSVVNGGVNGVGGGIGVGGVGGIGGVGVGSVAA
ncbi:hypothetical protein HDU76_007287 [Blyttiomyces sp. JEL0837]|nr:hypothetical protein HDU76_007287 [Blyttiomyces sp. JEL0837]